MQAKDARVGDTIRIEGVVVSNEHPHSAAIVVSIPGDDSVTIWNAATVELVKRALPEFEVGGILELNNKVRYVIVEPNVAVRIYTDTNRQGSMYRYDVTNNNKYEPNNEPTFGSLTVEEYPDRWTYYPPATSNDNGVKLG